MHIGFLNDHAVSTSHLFQYWKKISAEAGRICRTSLWPWQKTLKPDGCHTEEAESTAVAVAAPGSNKRPWLAYGFTGGVEAVSMNFLSR